MYTSLSLDSSWVDNVEIKNEIKEKTWIELNEPWRNEFFGYRGVWTTSEQLAKTIPAGVISAGPIGSDCPGWIIKSANELTSLPEEKFVFAISSEAAGECGEDSTLSLLQSLSASKHRCILRGAVGPEIIASSTLAGIEEVLLEELVWGTVPGLPDNWRWVWDHGSAHDVRILEHQKKISFWSKIGYPIYKALKSELTVVSNSVDSNISRASFGNRDVKTSWLPAGGVTGLAGMLSLKENLEDRLEQIEAIVSSLVKRSCDEWPWSAGKGWSQVVETKLPISQGPMANVSDSPMFARRISDKGAFPWLALAAMPEIQAEKLVKEAKEVMQSRPFGVGIIGMSTNDKLDQHIGICRKYGIEWVLVAAGSVELAKRLINDGMSIVLHTPAVKMLESAVTSGIRHTVWEGREAGGHVGSLCSASLWQLGIACCKALSMKPESVLLAGGLGSSTASLLASPFATSLRDLDIKAGMQIGSAYLMTKDAVELGCLTPVYSSLIKQVDKTVVIGEQSGAPTRVMANQRAKELIDLEMNWLAQGLPSKERKHLFEKANYGGLRLATKSEKFDLVDGYKKIVAIPQKECESGGLFHIGSNLSTYITDSVEVLHGSVTEKPETDCFKNSKIQNDRLDNSDPFKLNDNPTYTQSNKYSADEKCPIAIVGMGFRLPGAEKSEAEFWDHLLRKECAIKEVDNGRWSVDSFLDKEKNSKCKTYTNLGALINPPAFNNTRYRLPPKVVEAIDEVQLLALELADDALLDSGYVHGECNERTDVILGVSQGDRRVLTELGVFIDALRRKGVEGESLDSAIKEVFGGVIPLPSSDSLPGELANVVSGRVAQCFNFNGANFSVDAACASSLVALSTAIDRLRSHKCDWAISGGVDRAMGVGGYVKFSQMGALSRHGIYPFDKKASGFVMGEGGAVFVLRRLSDAIKDEQDIKAVIYGYGLSSDGKGKGIAAPNVKGQVQAINRAWQDAGVTKDNIRWIEAHGTGTTVGDLVEVSALREVFRGATHNVGIGSVKGNIGHLKASAGAASIVKAVLSIQHKTIPPSGGYSQRRRDLELEGSGIYVMEKQEPWLEKQEYVGVSSFGFGGTNVHVVLGPEYNCSPISDLQIPTSTSQSDSIMSDRSQISNYRGGIAMLSSESGMKNIRNNEDCSVNEDIDGQKNLIKSDLVAIIASETGYEADEIPGDADFEGDLGIDTIQLAEIYSVVKDKYSVLERVDVPLSSVSNLDALSDIVFQAIISDCNDSEQLKEGVHGASTIDSSGDNFDPSREREEIATLVIDIISSVSGYDADDIESGSDLEGDLGIDTISIAEIVSLVKDKFLIEDDPSFVLSDVSSVDKLVEYILYSRNRSEVDYTNSQENDGNRVSVSSSIKFWENVVDENLYVSADCAENVIRAYEDGASFSQSDEFRLSIDKNCKKPKRVIDGIKLNWGPVKWQRIGGYYSRKSAGRFAFVFPGQGTQCLGMLDELRGIDVVEDTIKEADNILKSILGVSIDRYLKPEEGCNRDQLEYELRQTRITQPVLLTVSVALFRLLTSVGIVPVCVAGHSLGEFSACVAAGVMDFSDALRIVAGRGEAMEKLASEVKDPGAMVAVALGSKDIVRILDEYDYSDLELANVNSDAQVVVGGATSQVVSLCGVLEKLGVPHSRLNVSHAFHTKYVAKATVALEEILFNIDLKLPITPIFSNVTGQRYPDSVDDIRRLLSVQLAKPVRFSDMIVEMSSLQVDGVIEVGSGRVLSGLVKEIFNSELPAWPSYIVGQPSVSTLAKLVAGYWTLGGNLKNVNVKTISTFQIEDGKDNNQYPLGKEANSYKDNIKTDNIEECRLQDIRGYDSVPEENLHGKSSYGTIELESIVVSGMSAGVPGFNDPFSSVSFNSLMEGNNRISVVPPSVKKKLVGLGISRITKEYNGELTVARISSEEETVQFSGQIGYEVDLKEFGVSAKAQSELDPTSLLAICAGYNALKDAGIPLVKSSGHRSSESSLRLPRKIGNRTGIIYASIFGGVDAWISAADSSKPFPRSFAIDSLSLAHSHLARWIGAHGPTLRVNSACSSTISALSIAEDWIRLGRADRVIIIAADIAGNEELLPYVGAAFQVVGAASTDPNLESAVRPFGSGRQGTIIGSGALGFVVESEKSCSQRGYRHQAKLLGTEISNDACHPLRMNPDSIASSLDRLLNRVQEASGMSRSEIAKQMFFVSHEPFTPAKGGSAISEAKALKTCFGDDVCRIPVVNVKGYTGHPMGASLEDVVAIECLNRSYIPPVRNREFLDPSLSDLQLSAGQRTDAKYALHLAAGFGAQIGWVLYERGLDSGNKAVKEDYRNWLTNICEEDEVASVHRLHTKKENDGARLKIEDPFSKKIALKASEPPVHVLRKQWASLPHQSSKSSQSLVFRSDELYDPFVTNPFSDDDVKTMVCTWLSLLVEGKYKGIKLPYTSDNTWIKVASSALAAATRSWRLETGSMQCIVVWYDGSLNVSETFSVSNLQKEVLVSEAGMLSPLWLPVPKLQNLNKTLVRAPKGVWLIVGGGRGIASLLVERWLDCGNTKMYLCGRRAKPTVDLFSCDESIANQRIKDRMGANADPTKFRLYREDHLADVELAKTIYSDKYRSSDAEYIQCNFVDTDQVDNLIRQFQNDGVTLDGVIYAAGVELSKSASKIERNDVDRVVDPKIVGALNSLKLATKCGAKHWIGFSSVAASIGNPGQTVYSAANAAMTALADDFRSKLKINVIDWTAWEGAGMATRGAIPTLLKSQGIKCLTKSNGFAILESLLFDQHDDVNDLMVVCETNSDLIFTESVEGLEATNLVRSSDKCLDSHRIDGNIVYPGVFGLQSVWDYHGSKRTVDMSFERSIRISDDSDKCLSLGSNDAQGFIAEHDNCQRLRRIPAYTFSFSDKEIQRVSPWSSEGWVCLGDSVDIYTILFHGPDFQVLQDCWCKGDAAWGSVFLLDNQNETKRRAFALESLFQIGGLWARYSKRVDCLPVHVSVSVESGATDFDTGVGRVEFVNQENEALIFRGEWLDSSGKLCISALFRMRIVRSDLEAIGFREIPYLDEIENYDADLSCSNKRERQSQASLKAWDRAIKRVILGVIGRINGNVDSPRPGIPLIYAGQKFSWSRTHSSGVAYSVVTPGSSPIGVDLEGLAFRKSVFWKDISNDTEKKAIGSTPNSTDQLVVWCCKESVLKCLGIGLSVPLPQLTVRITGFGKANVELHGDAEVKAAEVGIGRFLDVRFYVENRFVTAIAVPKKEQ